MATKTTTYDGITFTITDTAPNYHTITKPNYDMVGYIGVHASEGDEEAHYGVAFDPAYVSERGIEIGGRFALFTDALDKACGYILHNEAEETKDSEAAEVGTKPDNAHTLLAGEFSKL